MIKDNHTEVLFFIFFCFGRMSKVSIMTLLYCSLPMMSTCSNFPETLPSFTLIPTNSILNKLGQIISDMFIKK